MEFGIDLGLPREGEIDSLLAAQPFPGNTWAPRWRQLGGTITIQSLQLLLRMFTPHLGWTTGASGHHPAPERPTEQPAHLPTWPLAKTPHPSWGLATCSPASQDILPLQTARLLRAGCDSDRGNHRPPFAQGPSRKNPQARCGLPGRPVTPTGRLLGPVTTAHMTPLHAALTSAWSEAAPVLGVT